MQLVHEGDDVAFVGYGDVDAFKLAGGEEGRETVGKKGAQLIIRRAEIAVQAGGEAVSQRVPDQPDSHCVTS